MNYKIHNDNKVFPYLVIDDFYNEDEQELIWNELILLNVLFKKEDGVSGNIAVDEDGTKKGEASRLYLDVLYKDKREQSNILKVYQKIVSDDVVKLYKHTTPSWVTFDSANNDFSQVSYYESSDYYKEHFDNYMHSCLIWFFQEPKKFKGGNLKFTQSFKTVKCKHNRMVLFPSYYLHEVDKIIMKKKDMKKNLGRYCLTHFYNRI